MRAVNYFIFAFFAVCGAVQVDNNPWKVSNPETNRWLRKGKNVATETTTPDTVTTTLNLTSTYLPKTSAKYEKKNLKFSTLTKSIMQATTSVLTSTSTPQASSKMHTFPLTSVTFPDTTHSTSEASYSESTDTTETTLEPRENPKPHDFYSIKEKSREKLHVKIASNISQNLLPLPAGASAALVKPTKYHYYPHNQHIYLLPECAIQQVCNAVYIRLNWTQPLCACPSRYRDPCSASLNADDLHTTELMVERKSKALTLVKTCEPISDMRICRAPRDWSLLALQNIRTGKSHYLVICRCPESRILEGPMSHDQPTYASVPGIRVYGMICTDDNRSRRQFPYRTTRSLKDAPPFPFEKAYEFALNANWD
ncbi:uncharacterized protein LOC123686247 [Harmonia axyridis]|uniref:uncharacterized protein LOC123686247 n=1 Tax=Harmonia axyridis TaxID=115357 RepID=UPI001E275DDA|nr:uncharacterized protein LOC123686247 [Harmonia axyridis]